MKIKTSLLLVTTISLFTACGKAPNQNDIVQDAFNQNVSQKESELTPLAGRYEGTLTFNNGETKNIVLQLIPTIMIVQNPGRNDVTEMPTLGGNINVYFDYEDRTDVIPIAQFTNSMYNINTGHLRLNGTIQTGTSIGAVMNTFDGSIRGRTIKGRLSNTSRGDLGLVEVTKVTIDETTEQQKK